MPAQLVLVVDDDRALIETVQDQLQLSGYQTAFASNAAGALYQVVTLKPDLVILDLKMPDMDGLILLGKLRATNPIPIIVLSARQEQADRVMALRIGADDYITKPFDIDDLEARVGAVLRRSRRVLPPQDGQPLELGSLRITKDGQFLDGQPVYITPTERVLLMALVERAGELVTHDDLAMRVWGAVDKSTSHLVDVHVSRLRARLRLRHSALEIITPARGRGFRIQVKS